MKRLALIFALVLSIGAFSATANAIEVGSNVIDNVAEAKVSGNDEFASLTGTFVKKVNNNEYIFGDKTGEILVRVAPELVEKVDSCLGRPASIEGNITQDIVSVEVDASKVVISNKVACK